VLVCKQLGQGGLRWPQIADGVVRLSAAGFATLAAKFAPLFDGLDWTRVQAVHRILLPTAPA
jgi:hypothetical protein